MSPEVLSNLQGLFTTKYKMLSENGESNERRLEINKIITYKMESVIDNPNFEKIKSNSVLWLQLIN